MGEIVDSLGGMVGKTIVGARRYGLVGFDDKPFLRLDFSDGSFCWVEAGLGLYTGESIFDDPLVISICDKFPSPGHWALGGPVDLVELLD